MDREGVAKNRTHSPTRIERPVGVLEHHLDVPADGSHRPTPELRDVLALEHDVSGGCRLESRHHPGERRLPATTLAYETERLAGANGKAHPVDRMYAGCAHSSQRPALDREVLHDVFDVEQDGSLIGVGCAHDHAAPVEPFVYEGAEFSSSSWFSPT